MGNNKSIKRDEALCGQEMEIQSKISEYENDVSYRAYEIVKKIMLKLFIKIALF